MSRALILTLALTLCAGTPALAEVNPIPGAGDPHIQSVAYDANEVVALHVAPGYAVTITLAPDEAIETVTLGDSVGWQVQVNHRADHLVVKPVGAVAPTNLTVITDQRDYNFSLYAMSGRVGIQPYLIRFTYPAPAASTATPPMVTGHYRLRGDPSLWPSAIREDGTFTTLRWPEGVALPAIYAEDHPGARALVNGVSEGGAMVIEGVHPRLAFVRGKARASAERIAEPAGPTAPPKAEPSAEPAAR